MESFASRLVPTQLSRPAPHAEEGLTRLETLGATLESKGFRVQALSWLPCSPPAGDLFSPQAHWIPTLTAAPVRPTPPRPTGARASLHHLRPASGSIHQAGLRLPRIHAVLFRGTHERGGNTAYPNPVRPLRPWLLPPGIVSPFRVSRAGSLRCSPRPGSAFPVCDSGRAPLAAGSAHSAPRTGAELRTPAPPLKPASWAGPACVPQAGALAQASPPWRGISPLPQPTITSRPAPLETPASTTAATGEGARAQPPTSPRLARPRPRSRAPPPPGPSRPLPGGALGLRWRVFRFA